VVNLTNSFHNLVINYGSDKFMDKLEKLRETLNNLIINKSDNREIINISKKLDKEILKFIKNEEKLIK
jgi:hypothetical protein